MTAASKTGDMPAFACASENGHQPGMTLHQWYVGQALQIATFKFTRLPDSAPLAAKYAIEIADALIAQLEKSKP